MTEERGMTTEGYVQSMRPDERLALLAQLEIWSGEAVAQVVVSCDASTPLDVAVTDQAWLKPIYHPRQCVCDWCWDKATNGL